MFEQSSSKITNHYWINQKNLDKSSNFYLKSKKKSSKVWIVWAVSWLDFNLVLKNPYSSSKVISDGLLKRSNSQSLEQKGV